MRIQNKLHGGKKDVERITGAWWWEKTRTEAVLA
jgi:hypothetical protein